MSAWRVGSETAATSAGGPVAFGAEQGTSENVVTAVIDRLTKWIPGDALALYVAAVTVFTAPHGAKPSVILLIVFVLLCAGIVVGSSFASTGEIPRSVVLPAVLASMAFAIWSLSVPLSGWHRWIFVSNNQAAVAVIAAIAGLLFGFLADGFTKRAAKRQATPPDGGSSP